MTSNIVQAWPYAYIYKRVRKVLLWYYGERFDLFQVHNEGHLLVAKDEQELVFLIRHLNLSYEVFWDEIAEFNLDHFFVALDSLQPNQDLLTKECNLLLDGCNLLDDFAHTLGIFDELELFNDPTQLNIYHKFFYGNNLPSIKKDKPDYHPVFQSNEIKVLQRAVYRAWHDIICHALEIIS